MKILKIIKSTCLLLIIFILTSCSSDGLDKYRNNSQYIEIDFNQLLDKMSKNEDFVFLLRKEGCSSCKKFYPEVASYLDKNPQKTIYSINYDIIEPLNTATLASNIFSSLGSDYYDHYEYSYSSLYTPTMVKVVDGRFYNSIINVSTQSDIENLFIDNFYHYDYYYNLSRLISLEDDFAFFVSKENDDAYVTLLKDYFINNEDKLGYSLDLCDFTQENNNKLLKRINYYLGEDNAIDKLPDYFYLKYLDGDLVDYKEIKFDVNTLNELYNEGE